MDASKPIAVSTRIVRHRPRSTSRREATDRRRTTTNPQSNGFLSREPKVDVDGRARLARSRSSSMDDMETVSVDVEGRKPSKSKSLRDSFDAVRGAVLAPSEPPSAASTTRSFTTKVRSAFTGLVTGLVKDVSMTFDEAWTNREEREVREDARERKKRARTLVAERKKRARDAKSRAELRAMRPATEVWTMGVHEKNAIGLDCDEMHFVPIGEASGWSAALLRYRADGGAAETTTRRPIIMVPGCASNAMTFDVDKSVSLARYLSERGHEVWIVESRGVGYARRWSRPRSDYVNFIKVDDGDGVEREVEVPKMRSVGFGLWDFDTLLNEDLFCACEYVARVGGRGDLAGVGHSMGGMLVGALAAIGPKPSDIGVSSSWSMTRVCTIASCLECSEESDPESPVSVYARFSAMAGHLPRGLTANPSTTFVHLPIAPASVATAEAFQFVLGPPPPIDGSKPDPAKAFWQNSVSPVTCHPGATDPEFLRRLLLRGFDNVPLSLLIQMATLFTPGGMRSRDPTMGVDESAGVRAKLTRDGERFRYIDELAAAQVPSLAVTGDVDPIFPPNQVRAYAKKIGAECHVFGDIDAPRDDPDAHFSHYDVICGRHAREKVFPTIARFFLELD